MQKREVSILAKTTDEHITALMHLLILMGLEKKEIFEISAALETTQELKYFLDILSENDYEMTPEEVYQAMGETITVFQTL